MENYLERINKVVFTPFEAKVFIEVFNEEIVRYGSYKVVEVLAWIYYETGKYTPKFLDYKYGWTELISLERNFIVSVSGNTILCKLNLPEPKEL